MGYTECRFLTERLIELFRDGTCTLISGLNSRSDDLSANVMVLNLVRAQGREPALEHIVLVARNFDREDLEVAHFKCWVAEVFTV